MLMGIVNDEPDDTPKKCQHQRHRTDARKNDRINVQSYLPLQQFSLPQLTYLAIIITSDNDTFLVLHQRRATLDASQERLTVGWQTTLRNKRMHKNAAVFPCACYSL